MFGQMKHPHVQLNVQSVVSDRLGLNPRWLSTYKLQGPRGVPRHISHLPLCASPVNGFQVVL